MRADWENNIVLVGNRRLMAEFAVEEIDARATPGSQRELRRALGALEGDPGQIDSLLKIVERVIFDEARAITHAAKI